MPLNLHDFDLIFGMDWLGVCRAQMDCFIKMVIMQMECGKRVVFRRERKLIQPTPPHDEKARRVMLCSGCTMTVPTILPLCHDWTGVVALPPFINTRGER